MWTRVEVIVGPELQDAVADFFVEQGVNGVVLEDKESGAVGVVAYISEEQEKHLSGALSEYLSSLRRFLPEAGNAVVSLSQAPDENWAVAWKEHFTPVAVGEKFIVTPPWLSPKPGGRCVIVIEPAEAFGTGTHETTQSCMVLLERAVDRLGLTPEQWTMLDVGCGSGILGFAAQGLGARLVMAVDNDLKAVASAVKNAKLNAMTDRTVFVCASVDSIKARADVVAANLDAATLKTHCAHISSLAMQRLVISGVSAEMWNAVSERFLERGLVLEEEIVSHEWGSGLFAAR
ncbi:MAG: 50S ribosomal protein L11 methyltransferase [Desulfomonilaceae bacterium]